MTSRSRYASNDEAAGTQGGPLGVPELPVIIISLACATSAGKAVNIVAINAKSNKSFFVFIMANNSVWIINAKCDTKLKTLISKNNNISKLWPDVNGLNNKYTAN